MWQIALAWPFVRAFFAGAWAHPASFHDVWVLAWEAFWEELLLLF